MQTFLPYTSYIMSAVVLDRQRLGKQRVEAAQLLRGLLITGSWTNHPASKMWKGHERSLAKYGLAICTEWISRGYRDSQETLFRTWIAELPETGLPSWFRSETFHRSHQSNLVRKFPEHYQKFFPNVPNDLPYVWPR
jgi:hypothetical protein